MITERYVTANGLQHHVLCHEGDPAKTVVLLHGYLDLARSFAPLIEALGGDGCRVFSPDFRGHGDTDRAPRGSYYHFMDYVADLDALFDALGVEKAHVVAHSMGGSVATRYAGARPERVRSLVLLEGVGMPGMPADVSVDRTVQWLDQLKKLRTRAPRTMASLDEVVSRMRVSHPSVGEETLRAVAEWSARQRDDGRWEFRFDPLHQTTSPMRFDGEAHEAYIDRVTCPVLIVDGGEDMSAWPDYDTRAARYRGARRVQISGAGHMMHWTRPEETARVVREGIAGG